MRFESPLALLLLFLIPLLLGEEGRSYLKARLGFKSKKSSSASIRFATTVRMKDLPRSFLTRYREQILAALKISSFILLTIALARPQYGNQISETETSGKDIMLTLDISGSMQALDFKLDGQNVDRLTALKKVVKDFIETRKGDRIGIVVFGTQSFTQCPLTQDTELLKQYVDALEIGMAGENTAIGDGLAIALKRIKDIEAESKVIVLVSDGDDTASALSPIQAAETAKKLGVKIHVIGIGGEGPAPMPMRDMFGRTVYRYAQLSFNEKLLKNIASETSGEYFFAKDTEKLSNIYDSIDKLESRKITTRAYVEYEERFWPYLILGFSLFFLHELLTCSLLSRIP